MLSYQHAFHAGNHADILKHYVLTFVLNSLNRKEKPYTMFDTHSGSGLYDLFDNRIVKTGEAEKGIEALLGVIARGAAPDAYPESFQNYVDLIKQYTDKNLYPGSPEIERRMLRSQDTLILSELHPQEIVNLRRNMEKPVVVGAATSADTTATGASATSTKAGAGTAGGAAGGGVEASHIKIHNRSGWEMIKALTPPSTKRGAVLIDPSYEETQDYLDAADTICHVNKKWSNGIIMLWYPLLAHREFEINNMINKITSSARNVNNNVEISNLQLEVYSKDDETKPRLFGSGMLVINSPWKLNEEGQVVVGYLQSQLAPLYK